MRYALLYVLLLLSPAVQGQTVLTGVATSFAGQQIKLTTFSDLISGTMRTVADDTIAADGRFRLAFDPEEVLPCVVKIGDIEAHLYLEPQQQYDIEFPLLDNAAAQRPEVLIASVKINEEGPAAINKYWRSFKQQYYEYLEAHYVDFMHKRMRLPSKAFADSMKASYAHVASPYFQELVRYQCAIMQLNSGRGKTVLFEDYLKDQPILYQNDAYMGFFNQFYDKNYHNTNYKGSAQFNELIELKRLFDKAGNPDKAKRNEQIRELRKILKGSEYKTNRDIAGNIIRKTNRLSVGNPAPDFTLVNQEGKTISLADFKGKYVYIDFWATWCTPCLQEMEVIEQLHKKYGRKVVFLSISTDARPEAMKRFLKKHKYGWEFAHISGQPGLAEDYNVQGVPVYYLIDPDGYLVQSPAHRPTGKIEEYLVKVAGTRRTRKAFEAIRDYEDD